MMLTTLSAIFSGNATLVQVFGLIAAVLFLVLTFISITAKSTEAILTNLGFTLLSLAVVFLPVVVGSIH